MAVSQFVYGTWQAQPDSVSLSTMQQSMIPSANGKPTLKRITWSINGKIVSRDAGNPQQSVSNQISDAATAFNQNYGDIGFVGTNFYFRNADVFGGIVVIKPFSFNEVKG